MIRTGMGDKVGQSFMGGAQMVGGFAIAFAFGAELTAWLLLFLPVIVIIFTIFISSIIGGIREIAIAYA
jgi:hypothetical protein